jgi:hypothetical protein
MVNQYHKTDSYTNTFIIQNSHYFQFFKQEGRQLLLPVFFATAATRRVVAIFYYLTALPFIIVEVLVIFHESPRAMSVAACGRVTPVRVGDPSSSRAQ